MPDRHGDRAESARSSSIKYRATLLHPVEREHFPSNQAHGTLMGLAPPECRSAQAGQGASKDSALPTPAGLGPRHETLLPQPTNHLAATSMTPSLPRRCLQRHDASSAAAPTKLRFSPGRWMGGRRRSWMVPPRREHGTRRHRHRHSRQGRPWISPVLESPPHQHAFRPEIRRPRAATDQIRRCRMRSTKVGVEVFRSSVGGCRATAAPQPASTSTSPPVRPRMPDRIRAHRLPPSRWRLSARGRRLGV